jgi:hypothetical protein
MPEGNPIDQDQRHQMRRADRDRGASSNQLPTMASPQSVAKPSPVKRRLPPLTD